MASLKEDVKVSRRGRSDIGPGVAPSKRPQRVRVRVCDGVGVSVSCGRCGAVGVRQRVTVGQCSWRRVAVLDSRCVSECVLDSVCVCVCVAVSACVSVGVR